MEARENALPLNVFDSFKRISSVLEARERASCLARRQQQGQLLPTLQRGPGERGATEGLDFQDSGTVITFTEFTIGDCAVCHCGTLPMTVEHSHRDCQTHQNLREESLPAHTAVGEKLCGPMENLQRTAAYVPATRVQV